ncbi:hypothetical protein KQI16_10300 [Caproiciproducens sp. MSJ-32]|nr:hypothetical protein [Caproiciproducens sp. MSJ-32]
MILISRKRHGECILKKMTGRDVSDEEFKERVHGRVEFFFENLNLDRWFDLEKVVYTMEL